MKQPESANKPLQALPLGGVGCGAVEIGADGRFHNLTFNNNRMQGQEIPEIPNLFLALHLMQHGKSYSRLLQRELPVPQQPSCASPSIPKAHLFHRLLFPQANFQLNDPAAPVEVVWTFFSPFLAFDQEASGMPVFFASMRIKNRTKAPLEATALFNMENLTAHVNRRPPEQFPKIDRVLVDHVHPNDRPPEKSGESILRDKQRGSYYNGLRFGDAEASEWSNQYCLAVRRTDDLKMMTTIWDPEDPVQQQAFWEAFQEGGNLSMDIPAPATARAGAVAARCRLRPGQEERIDFAFSWYCPFFEIDGMQYANGYANEYPDAQSIAERALRHITYYHESIRDWQNRILASQLPDWLNRFLIDTCALLITNTQRTSEGRFGLLQNLRDGEVSALGQHLYYSFGALLFLPRHAQLALEHYLPKEETEESVLYPNLGDQGCCATETQLRLTEPTPLQVAHLVLSAYRDYMMTGNLARLQTLLPAIQQALLAVLEKDHNHDGLPESAPVMTLYNGLTVSALNSYTCGLWVCALKAMSVIMRIQLNWKQEKQWDGLFQLSRVSFEQHFWEETRGYYRLGSVEDAENPVAALSHTGQLMGQWYADFLGFGALFPEEHIERALDSVLRLNQRTAGLADLAHPNGAPYIFPDGESNLAWPALSIAHFASLCFYRHKPEAGMRVLKEWAQLQHQSGRWTCHAPTVWDMAQGKPVSDSPDHTADALSLWYVIYAFQGFQLYLREGLLRIMPSLPEGLHQINMPLFTSSCLGWLQFQEDDREAYWQCVQLSFDSPTWVKELELRIPDGVKSVEGVCREGDDPIAATCEIEVRDETRKVRIVFEQPKNISQNLYLKLMEKAPDVAEKEEPLRGRWLNKK